MRIRGISHNGIFEGNGHTVGFKGVGYEIGLRGISHTTGLMGQVPYGFKGNIPNTAINGHRANN